MATSRVQTNLVLTFEIAAKWQYVCYTQRFYRLISLNQPINFPCPLYYCDVTALPVNIMHNLVFADSVHKCYCTYPKISRFHVHPIFDGHLLEGLKYFKYRIPSNYGTYFDGVL